MTKQVQAVSKDVRMTSRKVGEVASLVRGRSVSDALTILEYTPRRAAKPVYKVIASAAANAEHNAKLNPKTLQIVSIEVGTGLSMKRFKPAARGRALPFKKMSSFIKVVVSGEEKQSKKTADKPAKTKDSETKAIAAKPETKETKSATVKDEEK